MMDRNAWLAIVLATALAVIGGLLLHQAGATVGGILGAVIGGSWPDRYEPIR